MKYYLRDKKVEGNVPSAASKQQIDDLMKSFDKDNARYLIRNISSIIFTVLRYYINTCKLHISVTQFEMIMRF